MTIMVGSQRGGARDLALHLMKPENEHIEVREIRGFMSDNVTGALNEAYAISKATRCRKFLYSLSANPPPDRQLSTDDLVSMIDEAEDRLGLTGQPRVVVIHEKEGRRHAHAVWSRVRCDELKAIHMPFDHRVLTQLTRDIVIERGWKLHPGMMDHKLRDPLSFNLAEYQQAKRIGKDPRLAKRALQEAWAISDSKTALVHAMQERGFKLARGDSGRPVAIDNHMEVYALARATQQKTKVIRERIGDVDDLMSVDQTKALIIREMQGVTQRLETEVEARAGVAQEKFEARRVALVERQKLERAALIKQQHEHWLSASRERQARFSSGLSGVWDRFRGEHKRIREQNEREAYEQARANQAARDDLAWRNLKERQRIDVWKSRYQDRARKIQRELKTNHSHSGPLLSPEF